MDDGFPLSGMDDHKTLIVSLLFYPTGWGPKIAKLVYKWLNNGLW